MGLWDWERLDEEVWTKNSVVLRARSYGLTLLRPWEGVCGPRINRSEELRHAPAPVISLYLILLGSVEGVRQAVVNEIWQNWGLETSALELCPTGAVVIAVISSSPLSARDLTWVKGGHSRMTVRLGNAGVVPGSNVHEGPEAGHEEIKNGVVFLPGESQGRGSQVGCRLWGHTESDTTEAT